MPYLLSLPNELLLLIADNLPAYTLSRTIQTCRHLHRLLTPHLHKLANKPRDSLPPLHWAASHGHTRLARHLVQSGHMPDAHDAKYQTPLLHAVKAGHASTVSYLLEAGANAIGEDPVLGGTPLHWAALGGHLEVVEVLLKTPGVSVHCRASGCGTSTRWLGPRQLANILVQGEREESVGRVLRHSAGGTPLHWAARGGRVAVIRALAKAGARVGDLDGEGAGVLHWGVLSGRKEVIAALVKAGARDVPDLRGESAADLATVAAGWVGFGEIGGALNKRRVWLRGLFR